MKIAQLIAYLNQQFPPETAAEWDNDGLSCCPDADREVKKVLVALDATSEAVAYAVQGGFDLLLTHHPLLFRPLSALTEANTVGEKLLKLARAGISAYAAHTRFDVAKGGVNDVLAELFELQEVTSFAPESEIPCGRVGNLKKEMTAEEFALLVKDKLGGHPKLSGAGTLRRVALLGGEGGDFVAAAKKAGADLFLAGRIGYHRMLDGREEGICLLEAGHYNTEFPALQKLAQTVKKANPTLETEIFSTDVLKTF